MMPVSPANFLSLQEPAAAREPGPDATPALEVDHLSHAYGARAALRDVSILVPASSFTVLLGLNGAGKSTLFALITRLFNAHQGTIRIFGRGLASAPSEALKLLGVVFQARTLDLELSVRQNLLYHAALHGLARRDARERAEQVLTEAGLGGREHDKARTLSGGQMRRLEIARALLHRPKLLLLDEPTAGLDIEAAADVLARVRALVDSGGAGVLWATHRIGEAKAADRIALLHEGRMLAQGGVPSILAAAGATGIQEAFAALTHRQAGAGGSE
jgi:ABC-2 type transport system ATP-binding protein